MKHLKWAWAGLAGGITGVTCCVAPVVLVLLGFGTTFSMMIMHHFHAVSIVSGVIFMLLLSLLIIKRDKGSCNIKSVKESWKTILGAIVAMVVALYAINYLLVYPVAAAVYGNLEVEQKQLGNLEEMNSMMNRETKIDLTPENMGHKKLMIVIDGLFCGSCGPALDYDLKSVEGVLAVDSKLEGTVWVEYDSDITNKHVILAQIHEPYIGEILDERCKKDGEWVAC